MMIADFPGYFDGSLHRKLLTNMLGSFVAFVIWNINFHLLALGVWKLVAFFVMSMARAFFLVVCVAFLSFLLTIHLFAVFLVGCVAFVAVFSGIFCFIHSVTFGYIPSLTWYENN